MTPVAGPFIVKRRRSVGESRTLGPMAEVLSMKAVADLDAAQCLAHDWALPGPRGERTHFLAALGLPATGGVVGPMRDGSEIHVEATTWRRLMHDVPMSLVRHFGLSGADKQHVCDRWNAEFGVSQEKARGGSNG